MTNTSPRGFTSVRPKVNTKTANVEKMTFMKDIVSSAAAFRDFMSENKEKQNDEEKDKEADAIGRQGKGKCAQTKEVLAFNVDAGQSDNDDGKVENMVDILEAADV